MDIVFMILFFFISTLTILFELFNNKRGRYLTKPFLMPLLILFYLTQANKINFFLVMGLTFAFLGDCFLMLQKRFFTIMIGIGTFLIGHVFYIIIFLQDTSFLKVVPIWFYLLIIPYLLFELYLIIKLYSSLKALKIPTLIYMNIIIIMSLTSLSRMFSVSIHSFILTFIGSLLFIFSDTVLAIDIFKKQRRYSNVYIMSSYIIAQFLIVFGLIN